MDDYNNPIPIDLLDESPMTMLAAAKEIARITGKKPNRSMIYRWSNRGIAGVRLPAISIGGERYTTREAIKRFLLAAEEARHSKTSKQTSEGIRKSKKKSEADRQLHKEAWELGIIGEEEARGWGFIE
jgi:hypothetical protein